MANEVRAVDPRVMNDLYAAFHAADNIILKKYVTSLSNAPCIEMSDALKQIELGSNVTLYRVERIVYDKNENIQDKLTTVYSAIFSLENCGLVMLIHGTEKGAELYLGVTVRDFYEQEGSSGETKLSVIGKKRDNYGRVLQNTFEGNFPGSELQLVMNIGGKTEKGIVRSKADIIEEFLGKAECVAAVSSIPAVRNGKEYKNHEFVQGLEKLIDTMRGKEYTALILADAMDNEKIEEMCAEYEDLYAQLSPFKSSSQTLSAQRSESETKSIVEGVTDTTNHTLSKAQSHGTSTSKTHTDTLGGSSSLNIGSHDGPLSGSVSLNYSHSYGRTTGENESTSETKSEGTAKSLTKQNSVAKALSESNGESIQINYENRAVKTLMDRIDEQIKRMRGCEDFGMFDTCAYFAAKEYSIAATAASAFKSLTRGENSSVESSAVNIWRDKVEVDYIKDYLMRFYHPEFLTVLDEKHQYSTTATMLISGKEMAYQMALPKKSVAGIPVVGCAEFGREIVQLNESSGSEIELGSIYHMYKKEQTPVRLNVRNLTAHTFITGSTGAGKSTTVYKMLDELIRSKASDTGEAVKFMVVEPAKGEYKNALAANTRLDVHVYGTNPKQTRLLRINPFRFPHEIHIYEHMDRLTEIFNVCWPMYAAMPAVLKAAIENAYRKAGWDLMTSENPYGEVYPCFADVANEVNAYINSSEYSDDTKGDYKGSLVTRLTSLTNGINGLIFAADDLSDEELFEQNTIVDLSRAGNPDTKALIMGILILKLQEYRMAQAKGSDAVLRHVTVLEEAHNLLKRTSTEQSSESANLVGKSVEMLANAIAEMRTYGEGFIIADQAPGLLDASVIRNTNTKIIMRLPDEEDRKLVGKAANLNDDQIAELAKLPRGVAAVYQSEWIGPVLCKVEKPDLKQETYDEPEPFQKQQEKSVLFDLLDRDFREKLDETEFRDGFRHAVLRAGVPTSVKLDLIEYLNAEGDEQKFRSLATAVYNAFRDAEKAVVYAADKPTMSEVREAILEALEIPAEEYDVQQINDLVYLLLWEYRELHLKTNPVWNDFLDNGRIV